jgi:hypothetical protein
MLYVMNSLIVPVDFNEKTKYTVLLRKISLKEAKEILSEIHFTSAVGHEATAKVLSELLGINIPFNRITVKLKAGDMCIHFALKTRLPEGKILTEEELKQLDYEFVLNMIC